LIGLRSTAYAHYCRLNLMKVKDDLFFHLCPSIRIMPGNDVKRILPLA
jgi:hypothetical protein